MAADLGREDGWMSRDQPVPDAAGRSDLRVALDSFDGEDRHLLGLLLLDGLDTAGVAAATGLDVRLLALRLWRLRLRAEQAVGALRIVRELEVAPSAGCAGLRAEAAGRDGGFTAELRTAVCRHAAGCARCRRSWTSGVDDDRAAVGPGAGPAAGSADRATAVRTAVARTAVARSAVARSAAVDRVTGPRPRAVPALAVVLAAVAVMTGAVALVQAGAGGARHRALDALGDPTDVTR